MKIRTVTIIQPPLEGGLRHKRVMPLGIGYLAAYMRQQIPGLQLCFLDLHSSNLTVADGLRELENNPPDLLLLSFWTPMADYAHELMRRARVFLPAATKIVAGGIHPTIFPEETLEHCDIVVRGEGEETLVELIHCLNRGQDWGGVKGICYRKVGTVVTTPERELIDDLDRLPFPAWDLMPLARYSTPMHIIGGPRVPVIGSRGCPYSCSFCVSPFFWQRRLRWRRPARVVDEIVAIREQLGISSIHFWDDNMLLDRGYIEGLCRELLDRKVKIKWVGLTRASHLFTCRDLLPLMQESGCIGIEMGIESADAEAHKAVNKEERLELTLTAARLMKEHGIIPLFTYMALNPGDTLATYYRQADFIGAILDGCGRIEYFHHMPVPLYIGQLCTPHPGTELYKNARQLGVVNASRWTDYYHHRVNFIPNSLLDDIPAKQTDHLSYRELLICVKAQCASVYQFITPADGFFRRAAKVAFLLDFIQRLYAHCQGALTVRAIAERLQRRYRLSDDQLWNCLAVQVIALAQMGFIQSPGQSPPRPRREIDISGFGDTRRLARRLHFLDLIKRFLLPFGREPGRP